MKNFTFTTISQEVYEAEKCTISNQINLVEEISKLKFIFKSRFFTVIILIIPEFLYLSSPQYVIALLELGMGWGGQGREEGYDSEGGTGVNHRIMLISVGEKRTFVSAGVNVFILHSALISIPGAVIQPQRIQYNQILSQRL